MCIRDSALIQPTVEFHRLGLAVVDEQHRFGVDQRAALRDKGPRQGEEVISPHLLVMSATPIPRTLAPVSYTHLDVYKRQPLPRPPRCPLRPTPCPKGVRWSSPMTCSSS